VPIDPPGVSVPDPNDEPGVPVLLPVPDPNDDPDVPVPVDPPNEPLVEVPVLPRGVVPAGGS
jgi:hypothetical protein